MRIPEPAVIDFETFKIGAPSPIPPLPTSVAIKMPGRATKVYIFGHPTGNNCTFLEAKQALSDAFNCKDGVCAYNLKFDLSVAEYWFGIKRQDVLRYHDAMILAFLFNPNSKSIALKPLSEELLCIPPDEQDALADWLCGNKVFWNFKVSNSKSSTAKHPFGAYIAFAPGSIVKDYVKGDVDRTALLFKKLYKYITDNDMLEAYIREMKVLLITMDNEHKGLRVDMSLLKDDLKEYEELHSIAQTEILNILGDDSININSGSQLIKAMINSKLINLDKLGFTEKGSYKSDMDSIEQCCINKNLVALLKYYSQLSTCINTFMRPWLNTAEMYDGRIYTSWNQVKTADGGSKGARTGRFSSTPNFQNIPKEFNSIFSEQVGDKLPKWKYNRKYKTKYKPLPKMRKYILPEIGDIVLDRDYSQQEVRILAHFEDGKLMQQYIDDPWTDGYTFTQEYVNNEFNKDYSRKIIKGIVLGTMYGMGDALCAIKVGLEVNEAKTLKKTIINALPGIDELNKDLKDKYKNNEPFYTIGGRMYYCEDPIWKDGKRITFEYKMINTLIQGSAADVTKQAIINLQEGIEKAKATDKMSFMVSIHDEIVVSCKKSYYKNGMQILKDAMESVECDVVLLSEGKIGDNLADLIDYDKKGKFVFDKKI